MTTEQRVAPRRASDRTVVLERDQAVQTLERHRTMPVLALVTGALVERGWEVAEHGYVDPDGATYADVAGALLAQSEREIHGVDELDDTDITREPNHEDPAQMLVHRTTEAVMRALEEEFTFDELLPNVTVVASVPPYGRVGVASTEPDLTTTLYALSLGAGAIRRVARVHGGM
jgi:hypothetical protein